MKDIDKELDTQIADYLQKHTTWTGLEDYEQKVADLKALIATQINQARIEEVNGMREAMTFEHMTPTIYASKRLKELKGNK